MQLIFCKIEPFQARQIRQLNGDRAVVDLNTGVSRLTADGSGDGKTRVRGLLVPQKDENNSPADAGTGN